MSMRDQNIKPWGWKPIQNILMTAWHCPKILPEQLCIKPNYFLQNLFTFAWEKHLRTHCVQFSAIYQSIATMYFPIATFIRNCFWAVSFISVFAREIRKVTKRRASSANKRDILMTQVLHTQIKKGIVSFSSESHDSAAQLSPSFPVHLGNFHSLLCFSQGYVHSHPPSVLLPLYVFIIQWSPTVRKKTQCYYPVTYANVRKAPHWVTLKPIRTVD